MVAGEMDPGLEDEPTQAGQEPGGREHHMRSPIRARRLEPVDDMAVCGEREPVQREGAACGVPAEALDGEALMGGKQVAACRLSPLGSGLSRPDQVVMTTKLALRSARQ